MSLQGRYSLFNDFDIVGIDVTLNILHVNNLTNLCYCFKNQVSMYSSLLHMYTAFALEVAV